MDKFLNLKIGFFVLATLCAPSSAIEGKTNIRLSEALANLEASDSELRREKSAFRALRKQQNLPHTDVEEYAEFLAGLQRRMLEDCHVARIIGGEKAVKDFDCALPEFQKSSANSLSLGPDTAKTEQEKNQSLNDRLKRIEAEIDEKLLRRQETIRQNRRNRSMGSVASSGSGRNSSSGSGAAGTGENKKAGQREGSKASRANNGTGLSSPGEEKKANRNKTVPVEAPGTPSSSGRADPGNGLGDERPGKRAVVKEKITDRGSDDDIIARQLREAAERETDPIFKEKLWAEYRKYRESKK